MTISKKLRPETFAKKLDNLTDDECKVMAELFYGLGNWLVGRANAKTHFIDTIMRNQKHEINAFKFALDMYIDGENLEKAIYLASVKFAVSKNAIRYKIHDELKLKKRYELERRNNEIIQKYLSGASIENLATDYKLSHSQIYRIKEKL